MEAKGFWVFLLVISKISFHLLILEAILMYLGAYLSVARHGGCREMDMTHWCCFARLADLNMQNCYSHHTPFVPSIGLEPRIVWLTNASQFIHFPPDHSRPHSQGSRVRRRKPLQKRTVQRPNWPPKPSSTPLLQLLPLLPDPCTSPSLWRSFHP